MPLSKPYTQATTKAVTILNDRTLNGKTTDASPA